jgi:hypothetical protein
VDIQPPTKAERLHARALLNVRSGVATRRVHWARAVAGLLFLASLAAFAWFAVVGRLTALAFATGMLGGMASGFWVLARHQDVRHRVALRVCDWDRVERLAAEDTA